MTTNKVFFEFKQATPEIFQKAFYEGKDVCLTLPVVKSNFNLKQYKSTKIPSLTFKNDSTEELNNFLQNLNISKA